MKVDRKGGSSMSWFRHGGLGPSQLVIGIIVSYMLYMYIYVIMSQWHEVCVSHDSFCRMWPLDLCMLEVAPLQVPGRVDGP